MFRKPQQVSSRRTRVCPARWRMRHVDGRIELLEYRWLLASAPLAVNDTFALNEDTLLVADSESSLWAVALQQAQPLHWWRFEETSGGTIRDEGTAHIDGTLGGGVSLDAPGLVGRAAHFDGTGFVRIGQSSITSDWTVETIASVELEQSRAQSILGEKRSLTGSGSATSIRLNQYDQTGMLGYTLYAVADWTSSVPSPTQLAHVAFVGTSLGVDFYVDGALAGHLDPAVPLSRYVIGVGNVEETSPDTSDPMVGLIDELAIYDRALTAQEIAQHYQAMRDTVRGVTLDSRGVLDNDSDADGDPLTAVLVTPTANGQLELQSTGGFKYVPNADFNGTDTFTYIASDGVLQSSPATVTITVSPVPDRPVAADDGPYEVTRDTLLSVPVATGVLANDQDADGDPLTATLVTPPVSGSVEFHADGSFVYTPRPGMIGRDRFTYRVSDGALDSEVARVQISVLSAGGAAPRPKTTITRCPKTRNWSWTRPRGYRCRRSRFSCNRWLTTRSEIVCSPRFLPGQDRAAAPSRRSIRIRASWANRSRCRRARPDRDLRQRRDDACRGGRRSQRTVGGSGHHDARSQDHLRR